MRRTFVLALAVAACAAQPEPTPEAQLRGCWIARADDSATTMRWLPDRAHPGQLVGDKALYGPDGVSATERYGVAPTDEGWRFCKLEAQPNTPAACWMVAEGATGALESGRVFIDTHGDRLKIEVVSAEAREVIFEGERDGCD